MQKLIDRMKASRVTRYHTVPTIGVQNNAEHQWGVAQVLLFFWPDIDREVLIAALCHDLPEIKTGDIPAMTKMALSEESGLGLEALEDEAYISMGLENISYLGEPRLAWADMTELCLYCIFQRNLGNREISHVFDNGLSILRQRTDNLGSHKNAEVQKFMRALGATYGTRS